MDSVGWFIANLHQFLGHDTAAAFIGVRPGDRSACVICQYEQSPDETKKQAVIEALAGKAT